MVVAMAFGIGVGVGIVKVGVRSVAFGGGVAV